MRIERVTESDAMELSEIYRPYVEKTAISFEHTAPTREEFRGRIHSTLEAFPYIKAVSEDGKILGYCYAGKFRTRASYEWDAEVSIYVREDSRHTGVGSALYQTMEKLLKEMGFLSIYAGVAAPREDDPFVPDTSFKFHKAMGFKLVGIYEKVGYKLGTWHDLAFFEKPLSERCENPEHIHFGEWSL